VNDGGIDAAGGAGVGGAAAAAARAESGRRRRCDPERWFMSEAALTASNSTALTWSGVVF